MITIRPIEPADSAQWVAMRFALWPEEGDTWLAADASRYFATPERGQGSMPEVVLVAYVKNENGPTLVGFAEVSRRLYAEGCETSPVGFLEGWYVLPEWRRQGVGGALMTAAVAWAAAQGCREFASDALADNTLSATAHIALGFTEVEVIRCFRKDIPATAHP